MDQSRAAGPLPEPPLPTAGFAETWAAAARAGDDATRLALVRGADLVLPLPPDGAPGWATVQQPGPADQVRTWVPVWTSPEAMAASLAGTPAAAWTTAFRIASFLDLAVGWPDTRWGLAVDPGTEHPLFLESGTVARLAVPTLVEELAGDPARVAVVQQLVPFAAIDPLLAGRDTRVSGYVQLAADVAHIGAPTVLVAAIGRAAEEPELVTDDGSLHLLRWPVLGAELYRTPRGGVDEQRRDAVAGWLVEEPPFPGLGFSPGRDVPVREYRVDGVALPHDAGLLELDVHGTETLRARYDAVRGGWQYVLRRAAR